MVSDLGLMRKSAEYFNDEHLEELKLYLRLSVLAQLGPMLNREFSEAKDAYNAALMGIEGSLTDEEDAAATVQQANQKGGKCSKSCHKFKDRHPVRGPT